MARIYGEGHHQVARELMALAGKLAAGLSSSKATQIYERVEYVDGKLTEALTPEGWEPFEEVGIDTLNWPHFGGQ